MKIVLSLLLILIVCNLHAQQAAEKVTPKWSTVYIVVPKTTGYKDSMPNALLKYQQQQFKIGNNGKGFDIYKDRFDNMSVLKPDQTFASNMPVLMQPVLKNSVDYKEPRDTSDVRQLQEIFRANPVFKPKSFEPK
ncbi:hypothetical protein ACI6Q2_09880 [Chitinophagaceae bacterium LWZ2-11]